MIHIADDASFASMINSGVVVVDFWAEWCGPCKQMLPVLDDVSNELGEKAKVVKIEVDNNPETAAAYRIMSIPTVMIFKDGQLAEAPMIGVQEKQTLLDAVNKYL